MKSTQNLIIVISLLLFTIACGITGNEETDGQESQAISAGNGSDDPGRQNTLGEEESESAAEDDDSQQGKDKSVTVRFGKGRTSGAYKDTVYGGTKHVYSFGVVLDQRINVSIDSGDGSAYFTVYDPIGKRISLSGAEERNFSETVTESGNYKIEVVTRSDKTDYTVKFGATALPVKEEEEEEPQTGGVTKTVKFAKGRSSASYSGAVIRGDRDSYTLGAKRGQQMSVSISSVEDNAVFQIKGPSGYLRGAEPGSDRTSWSGQLPANGTYRVIVGGTRGNATYTITISIR